MAQKKVRLRTKFRFGYQFWYQNDGGDETKKMPLEVITFSTQKSTLKVEKRPKKIFAAKKELTLFKRGQKRVDMLYISGLPIRQVPKIKFTK